MEFCELQFLVLGWSEYDPKLLAERVVRPLQAFLTEQLQVRSIVLQAILHSAII